MGKIFSNVFQILTSMRFLLFFYIGCIIRKKHPNIQSNIMLLYGLLFLIINLICFTFLNIDLSINVNIIKGINLIVRCICEVSGAIMAFLLLSCCASKIHWEHKFVTNLTIVSFPIYLFHQQIIYVLLWNFQSMINPYIMCTLNFLCSIIVSYCISLTLMKYKVTKNIIGIK